MQLRLELETPAADDAASLPPSDRAFSHLKSGGERVPTPNSLSPARGGNRRRGSLSLPTAAAGARRGGDQGLGRRGRRRLEPGAEADSGPSGRGVRAARRRAVQLAAAGQPGRMRRQLEPEANPEATVVEAEAGARGGGGGGGGAAGRAGPDAGDWAAREAGARP